MAIKPEGCQRNISHDLFVQNKKYNSNLLKNRRADRQKDLSKKIAYTRDEFLNILSIFYNTRATYKII